MGNKSSVGELVYLASVYDIKAYQITARPGSAARDTISSPDRVHTFQEIVACTPLFDYRNVKASRREAEY